MDEQKKRLVELLLKSDPIGERDLDDEWEDGEIDDIADHLLEHGVLAPPLRMGETFYMIVTKRPKISAPEFSFVKQSRLTFYNLERTINEWGKTAFRTREEADRAMMKLEEHHGKA